MAILDDACKYYEAGLKGNCYKSYNPVSTYLHNRGLDKETINKFRLGYSCDREGLFVKLTLHLFYDTEDVVKSNLVYRDFHDQFWLDKFYNYIVIPVIKGDEVVGFTARLYGNGDPKHKHLNGSFKCPFNVNTIGTKDTLIITESPIDTMILDQQRYSAISVFGTNGFKSHFIDYLKDYKGKIVWIFDNDLNKAGLNGSLKSALLLFKEINTDSYIGRLPLLNKNMNKIDINSLYLSDKDSFNDIIDLSIENSISYLSTKHYKEYLKEEEKRQKRIGLKKQTKDTLEKIKELPIVYVLSKYIQLEKTKFGAMTFCPFHNDTKTKSLIIYSNSNQCYCMSGACDFRGDAVQFVQNYFRISFLDAMNKIKEDFGIS